MKTRKIFSKFKPYAWEMSTDDIASMMGLSSSEIVRMDTNTSPYLPKKSLGALSKVVTKMRVNDYPDTSYLALRKKLADYCKKRVDQFVVTNGADEALDIIAKTLLDPGDQVIIPYPSYSMFRVTSEIMGANAILVPRKNNFGVDIEAVKRKITKKTKIIFLCSPNNPTGNSVSRDEVEWLLESSGDQTIVADEAYFEFSGRTLAELIAKHDNLLIVRTFSKAFSMAGVRVGYIVASEDTISKLNIVRPPNSLGVISLFLARQALNDKASMNENVMSIVAERDLLAKAMGEEKQIEVFPSEANFILFRLRRGISEKLHGRLMKRGYVLRNFSDTLGIEGCLRVTVNTPKVNQSFLSAISQELRTLS